MREASRLVFVVFFFGCKFDLVSLWQSEAYEKEPPSANFAVGGGGERMV